MLRNVSGGRVPHFLKICAVLFLLAAPSLSAQEEVTIPKNIPAKDASPLPNLVAQQFYLKPDQKLQNKTVEIHGLVFVQASDRERNSQFAVVTDFGPQVVKSRVIPGLTDLQAAKKWVKENLQTQEFEGAEIKKISIPVTEGKTKDLYWVGHKGFDSLEAAQGEIAMTASIVEKQGGDFKAMAKQAQVLLTVPEGEEPIEIKTPAQFAKEEAMILKYFDQLDIGNELFGPFHGTAIGEKITWQSFGESSWRLTNLSDRHYDSQVGFWTNRLVFKGIRAPLSTIDPFVEVTPALDSSSTDFSSSIISYIGLEWRPFANNPWLFNTRPWSLPLLKFIQNYRFMAAYGDRRNLKDEITGSRDHDIIAGVTIFYEWGLDLPSVSERKASTIPDYIRNYVWGEYFGSYTFQHTNFSSEKVFDSFLFNSSLTMGVTLPSIPLPNNPVLSDLTFMPYMRFEHANNTQHSFSYQNYHFMAAGMRWMPFRNYRFKENEWLYKMKVFGEFVGVGKVRHFKQDDEVPFAIDYDWRVGLGWSSKRY